MDKTKVHIIKTILEVKIFIGIAKKDSIVFFLLSIDIDINTLETSIINVSGKSSPPGLQAI